MMQNKMVNQQPVQQDQAEETSESESVTLPVQKYPELRGIKSGSPVSISGEGNVSNSDGKNVTISLSKCDIQTENPADKALGKMMGKNSSSQGQSQDDGSEDY